jgi:cytochrome c-type biogenesis protein CcmH/NrfG
MLLRLLATPVRAPLSGALWLAGRIRDTAEAELNDPARLKERLRELERALEAGEIDEDTFEAEELAIIRRLADTGREAP